MLAPAIHQVLFEPPAWVLPWKPAIDMDFARQRYWGSGLSSFLNFTRATIANTFRADGTVIPVLTGQPKISNLGLLIEDANTNVCLWNRDLTNAAWTPTNITAALDQTGVDGTANGASSITATAGNGTITQAITLASSARWQSVFCKRITGTGTLEMSMDGGATYTTITPAGTAWERKSLATQTLANPAPTFRIATSGDAFGIDVVQNENRSNQPSSPIYTTTASVTRNIDSPLIIGRAQSIMVSGQFTYYIQTYGLQIYGGARIMGPDAETGPNGSTGVVSYDKNSANSFGVTLGSGTLAGRCNIILTNSDVSGRTMRANGSTLGSNANPIGAWTAPRLGGTGGAGDSLMGYIQRFAVWPQLLTADQSLVVSNYSG